MGVRRKWSKRKLAEKLEAKHRAIVAEAVGNRWPAITGTKGYAPLVRYLPNCSPLGVDVLAGALEAVRKRRQCVTEVPVTVPDEAGHEVDVKPEGDDGIDPAVGRQATD